MCAGVGSGRARAWMPRQMDESAEACEIIMTGTLSLRRTANRRAVISTEDMRPVPWGRGRGEVGKALGEHGMQ